MTRFTARCARTIALAALVAAALAPRLGAQDAVAPASDETEQIVAMVRCTLDGQESIGAGILVGAANDRLYVVTANHVVRRGPAACTDIRVELRSLPGEPVPATLTTSFDARRDVAVLSIAGLREKGIDAARLPFDRLGDPASLARGDGVYALGFPQGRPWGSNVAPIPIASVSDSLLVFETSQVVPGNSGGALLDRRREIVGLVLNVQPPEATARNIAQVVDLLRGWRFPVALRGRFALAEPDLVSAGEGFSCALRRDGAAFCWGSNDHGELGTGTRGASLEPVRVSTQLRFASVSAGSTFACGLTTEGEAFCWGNAGPDDGGPGAVPGERIQRRVPSAVAGAHRFASLSAGGAHACGVTTDGTAYCWGENDAGQLGDGTTTTHEIPVRVATSERFRSVTAGYAHACGLATDGRAYCWGARGVDRQAVAQARPVAVGGALRFAALSAGSFYTCGVATTGIGYCWGDNEFGQLGDGTTEPSREPRVVKGEHRFRRIVAKRATGRPHTCGLTIDGKAMCWGWISEALGRQDLDDTYTPGPVVGELSFRALSAGFSHTCGVTTRGDVYCWGDDRYGQLGDGATAARITPGLVPLPP